jgi:large conductance mechanosensitive channel
MLKGFKDFMFKGNVIDLAIAFVMGTAFTAVVKSFTDGIINPLIARIGGSDGIGLGFQLGEDGNPKTFVDLGTVITAGINFVLIAAVLYFVLVVPVDTIKKRKIQEGDEELTDNDVLLQIRDLLSGSNDKPHT